MTYAVLVSSDDGPSEPGRIDLGRDAVELSNGGSIRYADLGDVYLERRAGAAAANRASLVLVSRQGSRLRITSLEGLGALHELAEQLVHARGKAAA